MQVTHATRNDIPELCELLDVLFTQEAEFQPDRAAQTRGLMQIIDNSEVGRILVARQGADIVGMVNLLFTVSTALGARVALLEDMVVHSEFRGSGIGSALLQYAIAFARSVGCQRITLLTDRTNVPAQRFYQRHGFILCKMILLRLSLTE